ncbi:MAG TPA: PRC and DUF2382 domain-containing protein [Marmoricola sp.]|nr:PRC and DUF2382 domain-containing protein [Marmoricola sp.]
MIGNQEVQRLVSGGGNVVAEDGSKVGSIGQIYLDDRTSQPEWVTTKTGLFGNSESFVPLGEARIDGDDVVVPYAKDKVKDAPRVGDSDGHLDQQQEAELYRYYGLEHGGPADVSGEGTVGHDTSGPTTDSAMTRSEERLDVGTQQHEAGRVRLRKWVETENVSTTVPVTKERAVVEREPITDGNVDRALEGPAISDEEHEVILHEERPVVSKTTEPVERVRVGKDVVTEEETVSDDVRKERIEVEGDDHLK